MKTSQATFLHRGVIALLIASATLVALYVCFYNLGQQFSRADEVMYVRGTQGMLMHHSFLVPFLDDRPIFNKPPMLHWLSLASVSLLGESVITHRIPSAIAGFGVFVLVGLLTLRISRSHLASWLSVLILAGCSVFLGTNGLRSVGVESALSLLTVSCLWLLHCACDEVLEGITHTQLDSSHQQHWRATTTYAGILFGFAILTKSVAIGIIVPILVCYIVTRCYERAISWRVVRAALTPILVRFVVAAFPIPAIYYTYLACIDPEAFNVIISHEILHRVTRGYHNRDDLTFYLRLFFTSGKVFPPIFVVTSLCYGIWAYYKERNRHALLLVYWAVIPVLIFSYIPSRLPWYINPSIPPLAILIGLSLDHLSRSLVLRLNGHRATLRWAILAAWPLLLTGISFPYLTETYYRVNEASVIPVDRVVSSLRNHWARGVRTYISTDLQFDRQEVAYVHFLKPERIEISYAYSNNLFNAVEPQLLITSLRSLEQMPSLEGWAAYGVLEPWKSRHSHVVLLLRYTQQDTPPERFKAFSRVLSGAQLAEWLRRRPET